MGKIENSALGTISGTVGNLIIYQLNGKTVVRQKPGKKENYKPSKIQLFYQNSFRVVQQFLLPLEDHLNIGFEEFLTGGKRGIHLAMSWAMKNAIINEEDKPRLQIEKIRVSKGDLVQAADLILVKVESKSYRLSWTQNSFEGSARDSDRCHILIYHPVDKKVQYIQNGSFRKQGFHHFKLLNSFPDSNFYLYFSFSKKIRGNKSIFSDSQCIKGF